MATSMIDLMTTLDNSVFYSVSVCDSVWDSVRDSVWYSVRDSVWDSVYVHVRDSVAHFAYDYFN